MKTSGKAIIIAKRLLEENSGIITIFSKENGICSGVVNKLKLKSGIDIHQIGNLVDFQWNARLASHMGILRCELIKAYASRLMIDKHKLYSLNSLLNIISVSLKPSERYPKLFDELAIYIENLISGSFSFLDYIKFELFILSQIGYSLDISQCCASGVVEDLIYVSPKSGRAVSKEIGKDYSSKLLPLPIFLTSEFEPENREDIRNAFDLTGYFFRRYVFKDGKDPNYREMLLSSII